MAFRLQITYNYRFDNFIFQLFFRRKKRNRSSRIKVAAGVAADGGDGGGAREVSSSREPWQRGHHFSLVIRSVVGSDPSRFKAVSKFRKDQHSGSSTPVTFAI